MMGYESALIFGTYLEPENRENAQFKEYGTYVQVVSTFDLSKMDRHGPWATLLAESPINTDNMYVYHRSESAQYDDLYGERFKVIDPERLLAVLRKEAERSDYRRAHLAVDVVEAWVKHAHRFQGSVERAVILHYGY